MADANLNRKSAKELQKYLKERGVTFSDLRKAELVEICEAADRLGIDVDPDGLLEDGGYIKIKTSDTRGVDVTQPRNCKRITGSENITTFCHLWHI